MACGYVIRKSQYYDSVFLMRIARTLNDEPGVTQSAVLMATPPNKDLLAEIGVTGASIDEATANDLVVAILAADAAVIDPLLASIDERLQSVSSSKKSAFYRSVDEAALASPGSNLVVVSVPGAYAAREARKALEQGKHVFIFSDNVPVDQEVELKRLGRERGLLVMGPDCGTSLIGGVGIGFANRVRRGPVGVVGASGTGIQEFTCLVHRAGSGISHAIGTGSHDLADAVGGITTLMGIDALEADPATQVIAVVSKPAGKATLSTLMARIRVCKKPVIGCFLGLNERLQGAGENFHQAAAVDEAVQLALLHGRQARGIIEIAGRPKMADAAWRDASNWRPRQRYLRGLFAGGTFCYQTQQVLRYAGLAVYSNAPLDKRYKLENPQVSLEHSVIDLGDDYFTQGKPHPMIDAAERHKRILAEAADPEVAVLLLDFILGYVSSSDPTGDLLEAINSAKAIAGLRGDSLLVVASICGTDLDPQGLDRQHKQLEQAGVTVFSSNFQAARFCADLLVKTSGGAHGK
ncbi:MAG: acyl-CoA synthetase FdrA [Chloroflexota bacterium]